MSDSAASPRNSNHLTLVTDSLPRRWSARIHHAIRLWWRTRRDERFLLGQPDYLLKDIGIARTDIPSAVRNRLRL